MKTIKLNVKTKTKNYPIYFGDNILNQTGKLIKKNLPDVKKISVISDNKLPKKLLAKLVRSLKSYDVNLFKLTANEKNKSLTVANKIIQHLLKKNFNRSDCLIAFGGGVLGDLSAFISSLTKRGIKFVNIPTTLLSQVDSSIGGKTAINTSQGKNLIGTFYQPDFVLTDVSTLISLPYREMVCGYGEILKHSLILDKKFFIWLTRNGKQIIINKNKNIIKKAILKSCKIKTKIIEKDENEKNLRKVLNFGHTFAHGFEAAKNFSKKLNHGEAVILGMMMAVKFAYERKILPYSEMLKIKNHYLDLNLPTNLARYFKKNEINKIVSFMKKDKKNLNDKIILILIKKIGQVSKSFNYSLRTSEIKKFLSKQA